MASFTDQISQFNPYIQQLPVEAMTQVGMFKQQKYDEGVQKIQGYIDNVAGLDVVKPLHKQYLQSKLDELGNRLKTVAAGDFSNFQLVNSVGGMATQIVKDPTVQNAMVSTQVYRKGQQSLEEARKAGKNSIQNESWWNKTVNDWMDDGDLNTKFNGRYIDYRDMEKKLRDVAKEIHEYDNTVEIPYMRDNSGNVLYFDKSGNVSTNPSSGGAPRIDDAILKMRVKGKAAETILENFYISLDEDDKQQLGIDGWYHYRGYSGDQFKDKIKRDISETFNERKEMISAQIVKLSAELAENTKLTTQQKEVRRAKLEELQALSKGGELDKQLAARLSEVDVMDDLSLKKSVYSEKFLTTLANRMAYQDIETEYKTNPYQKALMDRKDLEFKYWNAQREQANANRNYGIAVARLNLDIAKEKRESEEARLKAAKDYRELYGEAPLWEAAGVTTDKELPTMNDLASDITSLDEEMNAFRVKYGRTIVGSNFDNMTPAEQRASLKLVLDNYLKDPKSAGDNNRRKLIERYRSMSVDMTRRMSNYTAIANESKVYDVQLDNALKNEKPITDKSGKTYDVKEAMSILSDIDNLTTIIQQPGRGQGMIKRDYSRAREKYRGTRYESLLKDVENNEPYVQSFKARTSGTAQNIYRQKTQFERGKIAQFLPQYQAAVSTLNMGEKGVKESVERVIGQMYALYGQLGDGKKEFDPETISNWRSGKGSGDLKYVLKKSQDNSSAYLEIYKGKEVQRIPLTGTQFMKYFPTAAQVSPIENFKYMVQGSPSKTTNAMNLKENSPAAAINAAFTGENLPLLAGTGLAPLVRFDIEGDDDNIGDENDLVQVRMYVNDNGVWKSDIVNKQGYATYGSLMNILGNIGTAEYERIKNLK